MPSNYFIEVLLFYIALYELPWEIFSQAQSLKKIKQVD